jgi:hypothetical protein
MFFAEALLIPEAQQVMITLSFSTWQYDLKVH